MKSPEASQTSGTVTSPCSCSRRSHVSKLMQNRPPSAYTVPQLFQNQTSSFSASIPSATISWPPRTVASAAISTRPVDLSGASKLEYQLTPVMTGPQHQGFERVLDADGVLVRADHPKLPGRLAHHEAASARLVRRVGLAFQLRFELVDPHGVLFVQRRTAGEVRRRIERTAKGVSPCTSQCAPGRTAIQWPDV